MTKAKKIHSVLFSDVVGSSSLYQKLGNQRAEEKINFAIRTMAGCARRFHGRVVKTIGDELMCVFDDTVDAVDAAIEMNRLVQEDELELRTGICSGQIIERDNDIFGDTVNDAAFLTKVARARQIVIDDNSLISFHENKNIFELIGEVTIKGKTKKSKIFRVNWETDLSISMSATIISHTDSKPAIKNEPELILNVGEQNFIIRASSEKFIIGREKDKIGCQVNQPRVSRKHCSIYFQQGKFVLEDHSTNGSFLKQRHIGETRVHRESLPLLSSGSFSLGQPIDKNSVVFHYSLA
jgi:adenylate cyclase